MSKLVVRAADIDDPNNDLRAKNCEYDERCICPMCHHALKPHVLSAYFLESEGLSYSRIAKLSLTCFCHRCREVFLCVYGDGVYRYDRDVNYAFQRLVSITPVSADTGLFSGEIASLSPSFVETFSQSALAEDENLIQVCGPGYRKSLEFLVKDYLCWKYPSEKDNIKKEFLGLSLKRIEDLRIKTLAERATWIGNDETHYVRKHVALDITTMKKFIKAMLNYIESELSYSDALSIEPQK